MNNIVYEKSTRRKKGGKKKRRTKRKKKGERLKKDMFTKELENEDGRRIKEMSAITTPACKIIEGRETAFNGF